MAALLNVDNLQVAFRGPRGEVPAVRGVSFSLGREKLGIVGESGSGKSTIGRAILRLLPDSARVTADRLTFEGQDLLGLSPRALRNLRGRHITMVMQDPRYSLNPVLPVGDQIAETLRVHGAGGRGRELYRKVLDILEAVQIRDPERVYRAYPHELSGGMGQRAMIAMMLIADPRLLIADEPTSALDVTVRRQILSILDDLVSRRGMGLILISHDLNLVAGFCDRVLILYAGRVVEEIEARNLHACRHPYSRGLLASLPRLEQPVGELATLQRDPAWLDGPVYRFGEEVSR
ncbi:ABC transporter ATP-binding protein [Aquibaculum arenosum]|nr:ABC transporter ATP-binding protein [Fodinicurvata sp. CAU 1616]